MSSSHYCFFSLRYHISADTDTPSYSWCGSFIVEFVPIHHLFISNHTKSYNIGYFVWAPRTTNHINIMCISDVPFNASDVEYVG